MKTQRAIYGDGSMTYLPAKGLYRVRIELGWGADGKRKRWEATSRTQAGALAKLREARKQIAIHGTIPAAGKPLEDWLEHWLERIVSQQVKPSTYRGYRLHCRNHIIPALGKVPIDKLTPAHIRTMRSKIMAEVSLATANGAHRALKTALSDAEREGLIVRNVAKLVPIPATHNTRSALDIADVKTIAAHLRRKPDEARWLVSLLTGARQAEVLGLTWDRVDLEIGTIDLAWQLQKLPVQHGCSKREPCGHKRASKCPQARFLVPPGFEYRQLDGPNCLTRPKSSSGMRVIPIPPILVEALKRHRKAHFSAANPHNLVFTRDDGGPVDAKTDREAWTAMLTAAGVTIVDLHSARHTAATLLMAQGVDVKIVQAVMGHAQATTTQLYQHADQTMARKAIDELAGSIKKA